MPWTEDQIVNLLNTNDRAVERAIVALYERQTADEKSVDSTRHDNKVGFRKNHASRLSKYARLIKRGCHLYPMQLSYVRPWVIMYREQLCEIANSKEAAKAARPSPEEIDRQEDERERRKANFAGADEPYDHAAPNGEPVPGPIPGTYAYTARLLAECGLMTGDEADEWKDRMKDESMGLR